jgi:2-hydroxycyclohexanecarboxyl-CoA dehydrogenase
METGLRGKTVIVTGGGSNIGRGIVLAFAEEKTNIVIAEIDEVQGQKVANKAKELGAQAVLVVRTDVTEYDQVDAMVRETLRHFKKIDVLVNNVGRGFPGQFMEKAREQWERETAFNFWSVISCTRAVLPHMIEQRSGRIVNIGSTAGLAGTVDIYGACKAAVIALSKALAREFGPYGITVNVVCPWRTLPECPEEDTGERSMWHPAKGFLGKLHTPELIEELAKSCPLRRLAKPSDIGPAAVFLASDAASFITGQTLSVDGGYTMLP